MKALKIADVKAFMGKLLIQNVFDEFLVSEVVLHTFVKFTFDGRLNKNFYSTEEIEELNGREYAKWGEQRPLAFSLVKGNKTPSAFHISLMLAKGGIEKVIANHGIPLRPEDVSGLYVHIKYDNNVLYVITGVGLNIFTMDKTLENAWDEQIEKFLHRNEIPFEIE